MPLVPAVIAPRAANVVIGVAIAAFLIVPVVVLRRRRWASRLGAALLVLLAVAVALPITGLGAPSEEELQRYAVIHAINGGPADSGGSPWLLPWYSADLLLIAAACLAAAALLPALGRAVHGDGRPALRPLRWRWPLLLWGVALALVSVPQALYVAAVADGSVDQGIILWDGSCAGALEAVLLGPVMIMLVLVPLPIMVAVGFGLWALLAGTGHRPLGRVVGWLTVVPLVASDLVLNWLPALGCARSSEEAAHPVTLAWAWHTLLPVVLIVLAVRLRRVSTPDENRPAAEKGAYDHA
ncbi:hypothetical protein SAMN05421869_118148 [Nonomuraea jiangxiensis]|uniref:Uncharacterized protein n=2 Tax=Nonomuraea jiangxiensis TaxID=633440 RepID=A0A1G9EFY9_9ACTN|nr:hypothetical protein SAMN05421869_118148 [Nonomuraea jiangxiensis]